MKRLSVGLLCVLCIAVLGSLSGAAEPAEAGLALTLDTQRTEYLLDEMFYVTLTLTNTGFQDEAFTRLLSPEFGVVTFEITTPDGQTHTFHPQGSGTLSREGVRDSVMWLPPRDRYSASVDLTYEMELSQGTPAEQRLSNGEDKPLPGPPEPRPATLLSAPGRYSIRACYLVPPNWPLEETVLWSNALKVFVAEPEGANLAAHKILRAGPGAEDRGIWNAFPEAAETYERVLDERPGSVYATYARWSLASVRDLAGIHDQRGTAQARGLIESAADLFLSAAKDAGHTPFGLRATEAAAKVLARLGRSGEAASLVEDAFLWPTTTDGDRVRLLRLMNHIETGYFQQASGLSGDEQTAQLRLPLRRFAEALGFSAGWDAGRRLVTLSSSKVNASFRLGGNSMVVNGRRRAGVRTSLQDGHAYVSPSVIATLMADHYGRGVATALEPMIAAVPAGEHP